MPTPNSPEDYAVAVSIAGGGCPATELFGDEVIRSNIDHRTVFILRKGLRAFIAGTAPELVKQKQEDYSGLLMRESSRDNFDDEQAPQIAQNLQQLVREHNIRVLYIVGGDGTAMGMQRILNAVDNPNEKPAVYLAPKTIDGDVIGTDTTIGFETAVQKVHREMRTYRVDAGKHDRMYFVQVPGRESGRLTYHGSKGHADIILVPEAPFSEQQIIDETTKLYKQQGYGIVAVAEGFQPVGVNPSEYKSHDRFGNNGRIAIAERLMGVTKNGMQSTLGSGQVIEEKAVDHHTITSPAVRGEEPIQEDRMLATAFGSAMIHYGKRHWEKRESLAFVMQQGEIKPIPLAEIVGGFRPLSTEFYDPTRIFTNTHRESLR